jgi:pyridoxine/pyridoxamine 5'-phosphate oxidase
MDKAAVIEFIRANPGMQLATVDAAGQPHTRGMFLYSVDGEGIIFHTGRFKTLYAELQANPRVEASFYEAAGMRQLRVKGLAREIDDAEFRLKVINTPGREFLRPLVAAQGPEVIRVFRIEACRATAWNMASNLTYPKPETVF